MQPGADRDSDRPTNVPVGISDALRTRRRFELLPVGAAGPVVLPEEPEASPFDFAAQFRFLLKHLWLILASILVALAAGAAITALTRPIYSAQATLQIDREAAKVVSGQDVTPSEQMVAGEEFFQTQYGLLRSRSLAQRVADDLKLADSDAFILAMAAKPPKLGAGGAPARQKARADQVVDLLQANVGVAPTRGSRLVAVSFSSPDPQLSARIANAFGENFIGANLDRRFESSSYARDFLERRIAQVKGRLEDSERQLVDYATQQGIIQLTDQNGGAAPGAERSLTASDLEALNGSLASAKAARILAEQHWREAQSAQGANLPEVLQNPTIQALMQQRAKMASDYQQKLALFKPNYPDMRQLQAQIDETDRQLKSQIESIRQSIRSQYDVALHNEQQLAGQVNGLKGSMLDLRQRSIQYNILQREVDTNRQLYDGLLQRYKEVGVAGGVTSNNINMVDRAQPPKGPSAPRPMQNLMLAGLAGLLGGLALSFLREALDQTIRAPADVEIKLGVPLLGAIPMLKTGVSPREALGDARSPLTEAYHSLRSALQFSTAQGFPATLLATSTRPGEGKSTTAFAVAQNMARLGFRTLLVDADLRNPSLHAMLGLDNRLGLTNILTGAALQKDVIQDSGQPNLFVIACGPLAPNPAELLAGERLKLFLAEAGAHFDLVICDGPPVMGLADAPLIGGSVDAVLVVVEAGRTTRSQARAALRRLGMGRSHVLGAVLTKFNSRASAYGYGYDQGYGYDYDYNYGSDPAKIESRKRGLTGLVSRTRRRLSSK